MITTQEPLIEATIFRVDQLKPFFKKLNSYRDERMFLSFPRDFWLELKKPNTAPNDGYVGDMQYEVSSIKSDFPNQLSCMYNLARVFDSKDVRVKAYSNLEMELEPINPLSTDDLFLKLVGFSDPRKGRTRDVQMLNKARIWRVEQLLGLSDWINSYRDKSLELCISSNTKVCVKLQKSESCNEQYEGDCRYDVTGKSQFHILERVAGIFSQTPVTVEVKNVPISPSYIPVPPMQLEKFILQCARYGNDPYF